MHTRTHTLTRTPQTHTLTHAHTHSHTHTTNTISARETGVPGLWGRGPPGPPGVASESLPISEDSTMTGTCEGPPGVTGMCEGAPGVQT